MGAAASLVVSPSIVYTSCRMLKPPLSFALGVLLPAILEATHIAADEALHSKGSFLLSDEVSQVFHWRVESFAIRSYSLNCGGPFNHVIDGIRRLFTPWSSSLSGRMVHDVAVAFIRDPDTLDLTYLLMSKGHKGDMTVSVFKSMEELDISGKPKVFGAPKRGWWKAKSKSKSLVVRDFVEMCASVAPEYQPVSNNCHHMTKELWNCHCERVAKVGIASRKIVFPRGVCKSYSDIASQKAAV